MTINCLFHCHGARKELTLVKLEITYEESCRWSQTMTLCVCTQLYACSRTMHHYNTLNMILTCDSFAAYLVNLLSKDRNGLQCNIAI